MCQTAEIEKAPRIHSVSHLPLSIPQFSVAQFRLQRVFFISVTLEDKANKTKRGKNIYRRSMSDCHHSSTKYFPHVLSHYGVSSVEISKDDAERLV